MDFNFSWRFEILIFGINTHFKYRILIYLFWPEWSLDRMIDFEVSKAENGWGNDLINFWIL